MFCTLYLWSLRSLPNHSTTYIYVYICTHAILACFQNQCIMEGLLTESEGTHPMLSHFSYSQTTVLMTNYNLSNKFPSSLPSLQKSLNHAVGIGKSRCRVCQLAHWEVVLSFTTSHSYSVPWRENLFKADCLSRI